MDRVFTLDDVAQCFANGPPCEDLSIEMMRVEVVGTILAAMLGHETIAQFFGPNRTDRRFEKARRYIRMDSSEDTPQAQVTRTARLAWLAEGLFNLQECEGFDRIISDIQNGELQAACEELACACHLAERGIPFRFVKSSKTQGEKSPDLEIQYRGQSVFCEIEGKDESTCLGAKTISNTLDHARKQLPKGRPGLIFLKLPDVWKSEEALTTMFGTIREFFSRTDRIIGIVWRAENHVDNGGDSEARYLMWPLRNESSNMLTDDMRALMKELARRNVFWRPIDAVVRHIIAKEQELAAATSPPGEATQ